MKRIVLLLGCIISFHTYAQVSSVTVNGAPFDPSKNLVKKGDTIIVNVCNVNPFVYEYSLESESVSYDFGTIPEIFKSQLLDIGEVEPEKAPVAEGFDFAPVETTEDDEKKKEDFRKKLEAIGDVVNRMKQLEIVTRKLRILVETSMPINVATIDDDRDNIISETLEIDCNGGYDCKNEIDEYFSSALSDLQAEIKQFNSDYESLDKRYKLAFVKNAIQVKEIENQIKPEDFKKKINGLLDFFDKINAEAFCISDTIIVKKSDDEIQLDFSQEARSDLQIISVSKTEKKELSSNILVGGCKIDFSGGFFGTGLGDHEFSTSQHINNGDTTQVISRKNFDDFEFSTGALLHIYCQGRFVSPTFSAGVSLNADETPRYLIGGGVMLGRKPRVILNVGRAFGKVQRLAAHQSLGDEVSNFDEVQTVTKNKGAWFFGLTYNLGK